MRNARHRAWHLAPLKGKSDYETLIEEEGKSFTGRGNAIALQIPSMPQRCLYRLCIALLCIAFRQPLIALYHRAQ